MSKTTELVIMMPSNLMNLEEKVVEAQNITLLLLGAFEHSEGEIKFGIAQPPDVYYCSHPNWCKCSDVKSCRICVLLEVTYTLFSLSFVRNYSGEYRGQYLVWRQPKPANLRGW